MGLITAAIAVGAAAMGVGAMKQARQARKQRRSAERDMERQKTEAREAMALNETRDDTGADIKLGDDREQGDSRRRSARRRLAAGSNQAPQRTGGVGMGSMLGSALFPDDK